MSDVIVPDLVVLGQVEGGVQISFWVETSATKYLTRINNINTIFLPSGEEREFGGKLLREFRGFPMGSAVARTVPLSDCPIVDPLGVLSRCHECHSCKTAKEDAGFGNPKG